MIKTAFENIVRRVENVSDQHFLLFPQCFQPKVFKEKKSS